MLCLRGLWLHNGRTELGYLQTGVRTGHFRLKSHTTIFFSFMILAVFFAILAGTVGTVHLFLGFYAAYLLFDMFPWRLRRREFQEPMRDAATYLQRHLSDLTSPKNDLRLSEHHRRSDARLARIQLRMLEVLIAFYFKRPRIRRVLVVFVLVLALETVAMALHFQISGSTSLGDLPGGLLRLLMINADRQRHEISAAGLTFSYDISRTAAYAVFVLIFAVSEFVLAHWRDEMRREITALEKRRDTIEESEERA